MLTLCPYTPMPYHPTTCTAAPVPYHANIVPLWSYYPTLHDIAAPVPYHANIVPLWSYFPTLHDIAARGPAARDNRGRATPAADVMHRDPGRAWGRRGCCVYVINNHSSNSLPVVKKSARDTRPIYLTPYKTYGV